MKYEILLDGIKKYGSSSEDTCKQIFGISGSQINQKVIIAPWWEPTIFDEFRNRATLISEVCTIKVWNLVYNLINITYIKTGIGSPVLTDVVLALGLTKCKEIVFIGSVGSLDENISIGDIVIPEYSICGDGTSRYLKGSPLKENDPFGEKAFPNQPFFEELIKATKNICAKNNVKHHIGRAFSIDTIFAQFAYIDEIKSMGCNVIEMETAAAFRAAEIASLKLVAILSVSDNSIINKSLISGRTDADKKYRKKTRNYVFPKIILSLFNNN